MRGTARLSAMVAAVYLFSKSAANADQNRRPDTPRQVSPFSACMADFKSRYNAYKGTGLGMAHTLWQTAVFRPKHKSSKVKNLYYTGQYNHPGVGVPTTVISSQILVNEMKKEGVLT